MQRELRKFGLLMGAMILLFFAGILPALFSRPIPRWPFPVSAVFFLLALFWPASLYGVNRVWMKFAEILGWINGHVLLSLLFYGVLTPMGGCIRWIGKKDLLALKRTAGDSYRQMVSPLSPHHMERPF